MPFVTKGRFP
jgi:hypothetical protein